MQAKSALTADNVYFLEQGLDLLAGMDDALFNSRPSIGLSPIGSHLRHCLDFYRSYLEGVGQGRIDYDERERDPRLECDRGYAMDVLRWTISRLEETSGVDEHMPVQVATDRSAAEQGDLAWSASTVRRELQFLRSHTVHHYALISVVLKLLGHPPAPDFGVAPSTLEHRRQLATAG
jgi:uncharacterized damage-inducible protein DinB